MHTAQIYQLVRELTVECEVLGVDKALHVPEPRLESDLKFTEPVLTFASLTAFVT